MIGIKDVAKRAGVAVSTVSKVVNDYPNVSEAMKKKVNKAIRELGFVPGSLASAISARQPAKIGIVINDDDPEVKGGINVQYLSGAVKKASELNLDAETLYTSVLRNKSVEETLTQLRNRNVKGLVFFGLSKNDENALELLKVTTLKKVVTNYMSVNDSTSFVGVDQCAASFDEVKAMLESNPVERILYLAGSEDRFETEERLSGAKKAASEKNVEILVRNADFCEKKARDIIFGEKEDYRMVVASSDLCAIGAMKALTEMDVFKHVCGFGGIPLMAYAADGMTTVKIDFEGVAAAAVSELSELLSGKKGRKVLCGYTVGKTEYHDVLG